MGSKLLGIVTKRDTDFVPNREAVTVESLMTPLQDLSCLVMLFPISQEVGWCFAHLPVSRVFALHDLRSTKID